MRNTNRTVLDTPDDDSSSSETDLDLPDALTFLEPVVVSSSTITKSKPTVVRVEESVEEEESKSEPMKITDSPKQTPRAKMTTNASASHHKQTPPERRQSQEQALNEQEQVATPGKRMPPPRASKRKQPVVHEEAAEPKDKRTKMATETQIVIQTTGLTEEQLKRMHSAADVISGQTFGSCMYKVTVYSDTGLLDKALGTPMIPALCTHLVVPVDRNGRATRTFKYLVGLACGATHVVTPEWLSACAEASCILPESEFHVIGDSATPNRTLKERPSPSIRPLSGIQLYLWDSGGETVWTKPGMHSIEQLKALATVAGAQVVNELDHTELSDTSNASDDSSEDDGGSQMTSPRLRRRRRSASAASGRTDRDIVGMLPPKYRTMFELPVGNGATVILVDMDDLCAANHRSTLRAIARAKAGGTACPCRTKSWLFDCISANTILA
ncbi:hypothetical protein EV175_002331 [Coemansia sp. RSA 1933]|nr:hypothetical protein EV175_002331 [Coemansia sp. RSA 1933]